MALHDMFLAANAYDEMCGDTKSGHPLEYILKQIRRSGNVGTTFVTSSGNYITFNSNYNVGVLANVTRNIDTENKTITLTAVYTITNNGTSDFTITKVVLTDNGKRVDKGVLSTGFIWVANTVLGTPVTIPAGGVGQVTLTIERACGDIKIADM